MSLCTLLCTSLIASTMTLGAYDGCQVPKLLCCPAVGRSFEELDPAARRYVGSVGEMKQALHL